jgi:hypothetical protein
VGRRKALVGVAGPLLIEQKTTWQRRLLAFLGGASANLGIPTSSLRKKPAGIVTAGGTLTLREAAYEEPIQGETGRWRH